MIYKYAVLRGIFGVAIFIDVEEIINPEIIEGDLQIIEGIYLRINGSLPFLSQRDIEKYIKRAIVELSEVIYQRLHGSLVCFYIKSVETNPVHFQEEGLYCAMRGWLAQTYDLKLEPVGVEYSNEERRFVFDI
jgi:hypothetical protein